MVGIFTAAGIRVLNSEQKVNVSTLVDSILMVEEDPPYAVHFEFDSTRVPNGLRRLLQYNAITCHLHELPVLSVLILLRPSADSPEYRWIASRKLVYCWVCGSMEQRSRTCSGGFQA